MPTSARSSRGRRRAAAPEQTPRQRMCWLAHCALMALSHGYKIRVETAGSRSDAEVVEGVLHAVPNDHPSARGDGGSTLLLQFRHGRSIPLERVARLARVGD